MANQEIVIGETTPLICISGGASFFYFWSINDQFSQALASSFIPNGWTVAQTATPGTFDIFVPSTVAAQINCQIACSNNPPTTLYTQTFDIIAITPPPDEHGWIRRKINLPFRRHRPAPKV